MSTKSVSVLGSFRLRIGDIDEVGLDRLHALSVLVGWPHRPDDWRLLRETGQGIAALDGIGRVLATAMWFPFGPRFATVGMVITSPRLQSRGGGRWMMDYVLGQTRGRALALNATKAARRLYASLGFVPGATVSQYQGIAALANEAQDATVRPIEPADLPALIALDRVAYGADRAALLARLLEGSTGYALLRQGNIGGFALCRRFGRGHVIGPVIAETPDDAIRLVRPHLTQRAGQFVRLDTAQSDGAFADLLTRAGLQVSDTVTGMTLRQAAPGQRSQIYALASHTVG